MPNSSLLVLHMGERAHVHTQCERSRKGKVPWLSEFGERCLLWHLGKIQNIKDSEKPAAKKPVLLTIINIMCFYQYWSRELLGWIIFKVLPLSNPSSQLRPTSWL